MGVTFHERIDEGQDDAAEGQVQCQGVGEQHHHQEGNQAQTGKQGNGLPGVDASGRQRPVPGPLDVFVPVPVGKIIDGTAGGAHEKDAEGEHNDVANAGTAVTGEPERPIGGPEQEQ